MPAVDIKRKLLLERLGKDQSYTHKEFADLCFDFGIELDQVTSQYEQILHENMVKYNKLPDEVKENKKKLFQAIPELKDADTEELYKIDVPANRYDLLCVEGLTRALRIFQMKDYQYANGNDKDIPCGNKSLRPSLKEVDPEIYAIIKEEKRQLLEAVGACLTNKYGKFEILGKKVSLKAFGLDVQQYSGSVCNLQHLPDEGHQNLICAVKEYLRSIDQSEVDGSSKFDCLFTWNNGCMKNMVGHKEDPFEYIVSIVRNNLCIQLKRSPITYIDYIRVMLGHIEDVFEYIWNMIIFFINYCLSMIASIPVWMIFAILCIAFIENVNANDGEAEGNKTHGAESISQLDIIWIVFIVIIGFYAIFICIVIRNLCHLNKYSHDISSNSDQPSENESDSSNESSDIEYSDEHLNSDEHFGSNEPLLA